MVKAFRPDIPPKQTLGAPDISVVLFVMLYQVVLTFESVDQILTCDHPNESYFCEQYIPGEMYLWCCVVQAFDGLWMQLLSMTVEFKINRSNDFREFVKAVSHT